MEPRSAKNTWYIRVFNTIRVGDDDVAHTQVSQIGDKPRPNATSANDADLGAVEQCLSDVCQEPRLAVVD